MFWMFILVPFCSILAQEATTLNHENLTHRISLRHDNDFLTFTDRYYSSGLFLNYSRILTHGIFNSGEEQVTIGLAQEIYTPSRLKTSNLAEMDRPYAGYFEFNTSWSYAKNNHGFESQLSIGVAGKASGAGAFHRWYHNALDIPGPPSWAYEIKNKVHANLYLNYIKEWQLSPNNFSVYFGVLPKIAVGTKDIYAQPEMVAHFGRRQNLASSMAYNRIGTTDQEVFFSLRAGYRFVLHNAMLEGHVFGDDSVFLVAPNDRLFFGGFDIKHRSAQNDYWFGYRFNQAETQQTKAHSYIVLMYARSF
jgi:hypothetical protein